MDLIDRTIDYIQTTKWSNIPSPVQHQLKRCLLDNLGAHMVGSITPLSQIGIKFALAQYSSPPEANVLVSGEKMNAIGASLANGFMSDALDMGDGDSQWTNGHPGACLISPLLVACQKFKPDCNGTDFLTALLVGYETGIRAGKIRHETYETYHSSGSWGAIAAVAAIGNLIKMDKVTLFNALGTAEYHAPIGPMRKGIVTPSMVKDSIAWGSGVAIQSVLLAQLGFTGIAPIFGDAKDPAVIESLGKDYQILNLYFKPYACCRWSQPAVTAAIRIWENHRPNPDEIESVIVRSHRDAQTLPLTPPANTEQAQYVMSHPVAAALIDGEADPTHQTPPRMFGQDLIELGNKVHFELDPEMDSQYPEKELATVTVIMKNGEKIESGLADPHWTKDTPPSDEQLEKKFFKLVNSIIGEDQAVEVAKTIWHFEDHLVQELLDLCIKK